MQPKDDLKLFIGGGYVAAQSGQTFETIDPAHNTPICRVHQAGQADVDAAVGSARQGFEVWSRMTGAARGRVLQKASELLRAHRDELARLETLDAGKPLSETPEADVDSGADCLEYFAGLASKLGGEYQEVDDAFFYTRREPLGVCAGIGAWNYPLQIVCWKAAPALAAGNAMVFKPAELTPLSAPRVAELLSEAGLPDGVLNVVQGFAETGRALVNHPGVAKVSLTGEAETGKLVASEAAKSSLKHVTMELGGKSPLLVFDDADLDNAVSGAMLGNFATQGEVCTNCTRVFVHEDVVDDFLDRLVARTKAIKLGDPADPSVQMGPLISREHQQVVLDYIETGRREGANLLIGGGAPGRPGARRGQLRPADDLRRLHRRHADRARGDLRAGDVGPDLPRRGEAIRRANDTPYGLASGVFTRDLNRAHRCARELQSGICWVNHYNVTPIEMTFGGAKQSGLGRENGRQAIEYYSQLKSVFVATGDCEAPF